MAHQVESMTYFGETPWHGLGSVLEESDRTDWNKVLVKSGLDWEVEKVDLLTIDGETIEDRQLVRRKSDNKHYGVLSRGFTPLQNKDAFQWFQPWLDAGLAKFETAGSLKGGAVIWALAEIQDISAEVVPGDVIKHHVLLSNSHDGTQAWRGGLTNTRVVCANTLSNAHKSAESKLLRVRHSKNIKDNILTVQNSMDLIRKEFLVDIELYKKLSRSSFNQDDVARLVKKVMFKNEDELSTRAKNIIEEIVNCVKVSPGSDFAPNTAWNAYNGINYFLLNKAGTKADESNRLYSAWFGLNKVNDQNILKELLQVAA